MYSTHTYWLVDDFFGFFGQVHIKWYIQKRIHMRVKRNDQTQWIGMNWGGAHDTKTDKIKMMQDDFNRI